MTMKQLLLVVVVFVADAGRVLTGAGKGVLRGNSAEVPNSTAVTVPQIPKPISLIDQTMGTLPPSFWMWKTTPAPQPPPMPNPQLIWVEQTAPPVPTTPPVPEQCYGCDCMYVFPGKFLNGGNIADDYTCIGGAAKVLVPEITWAGAPAGSGGTPQVLADDGSTCPKCKTFAVTIDDLDYPNGVGEVNNHLKNIFWAVNIPGDWKSLNPQNAYMKYKDLPVIALSRNELGELGMTPPCPRKGLHRYRLTIWALNSYMGDETDPVSPDTDAGTIKGKIASRELARASFFGQVNAPGGYPHPADIRAQQAADGTLVRGSFLQQLKSWKPNFNVTAWW